MAYLEGELKKYYSDDFKSLLQYSGDSFWALDPGLPEILEQINSNHQMQSIYSKKFQAPGLAEDNISYLRLAYSESIKKKLQALLIELVNHLDGFNSEIIIRDEKDLGNQIFDASSDLACKHNPDYFRVQHFYIALKSDDANKHEAFWSFLHSKLPSID